MPTPDLLTTLTLASYVYTTGVFLYLSRKIDVVKQNHMKHLLKAINELRTKAGLPLVDEPEL